VDSKVFEYLQYIFKYFLNYAFLKYLKYRLGRINIIVFKNHISIRYVKAFPIQKDHLLDSTLFSDSIFLILFYF